MDNISNASGRDEMFYSGQQPWHGKGTRLDSPATAEEALAAAGLNWEVRKVPLKLDVGLPVSSHVAIVRNDTCDILGVVGNRFEPLQNKDAFRFFDAVVGEKLAIYHTAGALGKGERIWILAKLPGTIKVIGEDVIEKYLLLAHAHDGSLRLTMLFSPIRTVCSNSLNASLSLKTERRATAKHTKNLGLRIGEMRETLGIVNGLYERLGEMSRHLVGAKMNEKQFAEYAKGVLDVKAEGELSTRTKNMLEEVSGLFGQGRGLELAGVRGTAWAGYNAIVEYVDYRRSRTDDSQFNSSLFGEGAQIKAKAFESALAFAGK